MDATTIRDPMGGANQSGLRDHNERLVLSLIQRHGGLPSAEIWHYRRQFDHQNPLPPAAAWEVTRPSAGGDWSMRLAFSPTPFTDYLPATRYV